MDFASFVSPFQFPEVFYDMSALKSILGLALFLAGVLLFSIWRERLAATQPEDRAKFLMFNPAGGSWLLAVFAVCGGIYFLFDSIFRFHL